jgi:hypothetical protein
MSCGSSKEKLVAKNSARDSPDRTAYQSTHQSGIVAVAAVPLNRGTEKQSPEEPTNGADNPTEDLAPN